MPARAWGRWAAGTGAAIGFHNIYSGNYPPFQAVASLRPGAGKRVRGQREMLGWAAVAWGAGGTQILPVVCAGLCPAQSI